MKIYVGLDEMRDVCNISTCNSVNTPIEVETEALSELSKLEGFYLESGKLVYSEEVYISKRKAKEKEAAITQAEHDMTYLKNKEFLEGLSDQDALLVAVLYPEWAPGIHYKAGMRVMFEDILYKVLCKHFSQEDWQPKDAPSLYAKVLAFETPTEEEPNEPTPWEQPDSTNGYPMNYRTSHKDHIWISLVDDNVWEPGAEGTESVWALDE